MMKMYVGCTVLIAILLASWSYTNKKNIAISDDMPVTALLAQLGEDLAEKKPNMNIAGVSVEAGEQLFKEGLANKPKGGTTKKQSKHFVCTSCHNVVREDPDLAVSDPQDRLIYTDDRGLPFLQGTTMHGAVSRETYYNGDYDKKYGDLVKPARYDVRGAIQLCAVECAQGRSLKDWELESVLAYLWSIDITVADLGLTESEMSQIEDQTVADEDKIALLKSKYLQGSPAHFIPPPVDRKKGSGLTGDTANGKLIYDNSCLHCHYRGKYSYYNLDDSKLSFRELSKLAGTYHRYSIYQVTRWGVPSKSGKKSYMPQYPVEKMSEQQLADLRAYIDMRAE